MIYRFKLINQGVGSERLGDCEICKKHVDSVYSLTIEKEYNFPEDNLKGVSEHGSVFGHKKCLEKVMEKYNAI